MNGEPWSVLQVAANHEKKVANQLAVRSLEHCLLCYTERSRWTDRTVTLERPLFPGYIFVRYSPESRISVISTPGVHKLLGDSKTGMVDSAEIDRIQAALANGCVLRPHLGISVGTRVRVCRGIFQDLEGVVTSLRHNCNVVLSLSSAAHYFSLQVDLTDIEVVRNARTEVSIPPGIPQLGQATASARFRMA